MGFRLVFGFWCGFYFVVGFVQYRILGVAGCGRWAGADGVAIFWIFVFATGVMQFLLVSGCAMWFDVHLVWVWVVWIG